MEYAETIARLGRQNLRATPAAQPTLSRERLKTLLQSYISAPSLRKKAEQRNQQSESNSRLFQRDRSVDNSDTPAETLLKLGRTLVARKELLTKEEAGLFMRGDVQLGRMGLIQLAGAEDKALSSAAILLIDELLLDDDIDHPSRDALTEAFVGVGFASLAKELCLDNHILNDETRQAAFRVALAVGAGHNDNLPLLFRNQRAALDLYLRWLKDENDPANDEDDESINTSSVIDVEEERSTISKSQQSFSRDDVGPKTWDEIARSVEEDDEFGDFDEVHAARLRSMIRFRDSASNMSDDGDSQSWIAREDIPAVEDTDPLRIKYNQGNSSLSQRVMPKQAATNPEALLEKLYADTSRAELARGFAHLDRELMSRDALQHKLVHDRLIDLVRVRQTVDGLGVSTQKGSGLCAKASQSLRAAKAVSDMSLAGVLSREKQITQTKHALDIVTTRTHYVFLLNFASALEDLIGKRKWEEAVEMVRRYNDECKITNAADDAKLPKLFRKARMANDASIANLVRVIESRLDTAPSREVIRAFVDMHEITPQSFRQVNTAKPILLASQDGEAFVRDTDLVLTAIAAEKAEMACVAMNARYEQSSLDLAEKASRAKAAILDLTSSLRPDLEPDGVPPNVHGRAKAARAACEKYSLAAVAVARHMNKMCAEYLQWTEPFDVFGIDLERSRGLVVERCVELLQAIVFDAAPPGVPGDTTVLLTVAKIGEAFWANAGPVLPTYSQSRTTASASDSSSQSGSQNSSQYRSFVQQTTHGFLSITTTGVLEFFADLNEAVTLTHAGFAPIARRCTETSLDYSLDEVVATLDLLSKSLPMISVDNLIPRVEDTFGDVDQKDEGKDFCVPLMKSAFEQMDNCLKGILQPLLKSCSSRAKPIEEALQTNERLTKAARYIGTILGRCAEQYRLRGNDVTGKGFLLLARDCQVLQHKVLKQLSFCDTTDLQAQFERLEPALATQFLRACSQHLSEKVLDLLSGPKDPVSGVRFAHQQTVDVSDSLTEENGNIKVGERWIAILHIIAESVGECEAFLGSRYAAKLKSGLARHVGTRIQAFVDSESAHVGQQTATEYVVSLSFISKVLYATGDEFGYSKAINILRPKTDLSETRINKVVESACVEYEWLVECFSRL